MNKPQKITKANLAKGNIGGNGHENWALLRLIPLMIGSSIPEQKPPWEILMDLKEIVEIAVSSKFTEEILGYLENKISDHRNLLIHCFPDLTPWPKHHFIEHYPHLICCFGPLVELWTMRFKSKHSFFKKVVHDVHNSRIYFTLSSKHQQLMAYHFDGPNLFKPRLHIGNIDTVRTTSLDELLRTAIKRKYLYQDTISLAKDIHFYGMHYVKDMIISVSQCSGLPDFYRILGIVVNLDKVSFVSRKLSSWFLEHYRSYKVVQHRYGDIEILDPEVLNDYRHLADYTVQGKLLVIPRTCLLY